VLGVCALPSAERQAHKKMIMPRRITRSLRCRFEIE
jgi:hypothetical protein